MQFYITLPVVTWRYTDWAGLLTNAVAGVMLNLDGTLGVWERSDGGQSGGRIAVSGK